MPEAIWVVAALAAAGVAYLAGRRHESSREEPVAELQRDDHEPPPGAAALQELIVETMQDGVLLIGADGATAFANEPLVRLLGSRPEGSSTLFPVALRRAVQDAAQRRGSSILIETGTPTRWLGVVTAPAGEDGAVLCIVRDETETRQLERVRRDFVANASHELKTPAASIQAAAETIREAAQSDPSAVPRFAEQLEREAARLARIVADLLDLSRLESGDGDEEDVAFDTVVHDEVDRLRGAALGASVTIDTELADGVHVRGSRRDLALLVRNLLENAVRASHEGGTVRVLLEGGDAAVLRVVDDGVGIPSRDIPRIFERFYRVDRARSRDTGGTGLGLAIVKHVAENHGGSVHVTSELGAGSTFEVRLPLVGEHAEDRSA